MTTNTVNHLWQWFSYLDVLFPKDGLCIFFGQPNRPKLERCEDSSGYIHMVCVRGATTKQALGQQLARLNGHWGELLFALQDVSNGVDVRHFGLLIHS